MDQAMEEFFGEAISTYTRVQAIEDGVLVDLTAHFPKDTRLYGNGNLKMTHRGNLKMTHPGLG